MKKVKQLALCLTLCLVGLFVLIACGTAEQVTEQTQLTDERTIPSEEQLDLLDAELDLLNQELGLLDDSEELLRNGQFEALRNKKGTPRGWQKSCRGSWQGQENMGIDNSNAVLIKRNACAIQTIRPKANQTLLSGQDFSFTCQVKPAQGKNGYADITFFEKRNQSYRVAEQKGNYRGIYFEGHRKSGMDQNQPVVTYYEEINGKAERVFAAITADADGWYTLTVEGTASDTLKRPYVALYTGAGSTLFDDCSLTIIDSSEPNTAPKAVDDELATKADTVLTFTAAELTTNDIDGDVLSITAITALVPAKGTLTDNADGSYSYDPNGAYAELLLTETATVSFDYTVSDGELTDTGTVTIKVTGTKVSPTNTAPKAVDDELETKADTALTFTATELTTNDSDADGDALSITTITTLTTGEGTLTDNADGTYSYTPAATYADLLITETATVSFDYTISDGELTDIGTVAITVTGTKVALTEEPISTGTGVGTIICDPACIGNYTIGTKLILTATPAAGSIFTGWTSCLSTPTATTCEVEVTATTNLGNISATFELVIFKSISVGAFHSCGFTTANEAYCWGAGFFGRLGTGNTTTVNEPTLVLKPIGVSAWKNISAGSDHNCGITTANEAYCWGNGNSGRLGTGNTTSVNEPTEVINPIGVSGWKSISAGRFHSCGVTTDNQAYCWGIGENGGLGTGNETTVSEPTPVINPTGVSGWNSISAGTRYSCGITTDNEAYCWGYGVFGQLGTGNTTSVNKPTPVINPTGVSKWNSISTSGSHSCGLTTDNQAYCWGAGDDGRLGTGNETKVNKPTPVINPTGVSAWNSISTTGSHSCGLTTDNQAYCWGAGGYGRLGTGNETTVSEPTPIVNPTGVSTWNSISAGGAHSCGLTTTNKAYCWGAGEYGRLGTGNETNVNEPTPVISP